MASKEICCLRGFVTTITSTADYGIDSGSDVIITTGSTSRFFLNGACPDFFQIEVDVAARRGVKGKASDDHFRKIDYKAASKALWEKIESNPDLRKQLNLDDDAIEGLKKGYKPDGFTWHHVGHTLNSDGKGSMMLVEQVPHDLFRHKGWFSFLKNGLI